MKKIIITISCALLLLPGLLHAQSFTGQLDDAAVEVYGSEDTTQGDITTIIGNIISVALSILGVLLLILIIYAGFLWMTAGGDEKQVTKAKSYLINAVIGLVIVLAAYAISEFVIESIQ